MTTIFLGGLACALIGLAAGFVCGSFFGAALYSSAGSRADSQTARQLQPLAMNVRNIEGNLRQIMAELDSQWKPIDDDEFGD